MRISNRIPSSDRFANEILDLRAKKSNIEKLGKLYDAVVGDGAFIPNNLSMRGIKKYQDRREFNKIKHQVMDSYLNHVSTMKEMMLDRKHHRHIGAAKFDLMNYYLLIGRTLNVDFNKCDD